MTDGRRVAGGGQPLDGRLGYGIGRMVTAVVVLEIAVMAEVIAAARGDWTMLPAASLGVGALVLGLGRYRGNPLYAWIALWLRFARRDRRRTPDPGPVPADERLVPLRELCPALAIDVAPGRSGDHLGVCFDGDGWVAVLRVEPDPQLLVELGTLTRLPIPALVDLLVTDDVALDSVQVLVYTTASRQREFADWPAHRDVLIALRLGPDAGGTAIEARGGGGEGAARALKHATTRAIESLAGAGVVTHPLTPDELICVLAGAAGTAADTPPGGIRRTAESWRHWRLDDGDHATAAVHWRRGTDISFTAACRVLDEVATPIKATSFTLSRDAAARLGCEVALRVGSAAADTEAAAELTRRARESRFQLRWLDGLQALGFAATLPLGRSVGKPMRLPTGALADLELPAGPGCVVLGYQVLDEPVAVQLFRPAPTSVVLITASYVARLLAFRALSAGARCQVTSPRPQGWLPLLEQFQDQAVLLPTGTTSSLAASAARPVLHCEETGLGYQSPPGALSGWQSSIRVLDPLALDASSAALSAADVIVLQSMPADQVDRLRATVAIADDLANWLPQIADDVVVVITKEQAIWCSLRPTAAETALLGAPVLVDG